MAEPSTANQQIVDGSVSVGALSASTNGLPEHLMVAVQSMNNTGGENGCEKKPILGTPSSSVHNSQTHACAVQAQQMYQAQSIAGVQQQQQNHAVSQVINSSQPGQGYVNINGNSVNVNSYGQMTASSGQIPGYGQMNSYAVGQQIPSNAQVLQTAVMPTQADPTNINSQPQMNNAQQQQNSSYTMPQMVLTAGQPIQGIQTAQLLIPTSSGMVSQQILTIPVNNTTSSQLIQMVTPGGQVFSSSVANLQAMSSVQQMGGAYLPNQQQIVQASATGNGYGQIPNGVVQSQTPQLITNAAGQILAMTQPTVVGSQQTVTAQPPSSNQPASQNVTSPVTLTNNIQQSSHPQAVINQPSIHNQNVQTQPKMEKPCSTTTEFSSPASSPLTIDFQSETCNSGSSTPLLSCVSSTQQCNQEPTSFNADASSTTSDNECLLNPPSPGAVNSLDGDVVDGINLEEIKDFAKAFKMRRLSLGLTQTQVGEALSAAEGPAYSQSAICRFEKLDITPKSALRIKPVLEQWLREAEERVKNGNEHLMDFITESSKKRKRRTSFAPQALVLLNEFFKTNTHPSGTEMTALAIRLNYDREVIRVWFCNKRQALKNTGKRMHPD